MKHWFSSDLHFGHKGILQFCPNSRPYASVEEMNQALIKNYQEQVSPEDHVYLLGDIFFCRADPAIEIIKQLPGHKHLIYGNHDKVIRSNSTLRSYFTSISDYKEIKVEGRDVVLFHYPIWEWSRIQYGSYHLFGHVHGNTTVPGRAMDVGIDTRLDGKLWSWEEIDTILNTREIRAHH